MPKNKKAAKAASLEMKALRPIAAANIFPPDQLDGCGCGKYLRPPDTFTAPSRRLFDALVAEGLAAPADS